MKKVRLFILISLLFRLNGFSQSITEVDFSINNQKMYVTFKLVGVEEIPKFSYDFCIKIIKRDNPDIITAKSISGDVINTTTNGDKLIIWDIFKDIEFLEGDFKVEVYICNKNPNALPPINLFDKNSTNKKRKSGLILPLSAAAIGGGALVFSQMQYTKYMNTSIQSEMDKYFASANLMQKVGLLNAGIGVIWTTIKLVSKKGKSKNYNARLDINPTGLTYKLN